MQNVQSFRIPSKHGVSRQLEQIILSGSKIISFHVYEVESNSGISPVYDLLVVSEKMK